MIVTARKVSKPALRRIVEDPKGKYQDSDNGARRSGRPEGVPNEQGYVLKTAD